MTSELNTFVSLDEIKGILFECHGCHAKLTLPLKGIKTPPMSCGNCGADWYQGSHDSRFITLNGLLVRLRDLRDEKLAFDLTLEMPTASASGHASGGKD